MFQQPDDFKDESEALFDLINELSDDQLCRQTQFKHWTINDIVTHLHMWNWAADLSLNDESALLEFIGQVKSQIPQIGMRKFETHWINGLAGQALVSRWREYYTEMAARWVDADPRIRLKWAGPDMSVLSSITARLMETWRTGRPFLISLELNGWIQTESTILRYWE